jgi:HAMP domain-containing protein
VKRKLAKLGKWAGKGGLIAADIAVPRRAAAVRALISGPDKGQPDATPVAGPVADGAISASAIGGIVYAISTYLGLELTAEEIGALALAAGVLVGAWRRRRGQGGGPNA